MSNEKRVQQIRDAARYKYPDERIHFIDGAKWADSHPQWIPVEEELPKINDVASSWDCSDEVYIYLATGSHCVGRYEHDKNTNEFYWVLYGVDKDIPVTHWMPIVPPRKEE